jgi:hypothetical protein
LYHLECASCKVCKSGIDKGALYVWGDAFVHEDCSSYMSSGDNKRTATAVLSFKDQPSYLERQSRRRGKKVKQQIL